MPIARRLRPLRRLLRRMLTRPQLLAFVPALMLGGYWFGGEGVLLVVAVVFPMLLMIGGLFVEDGDGQGHVDGLTGLATRAHLVERLDDVLANYDGQGQSTIALALQIDDGAELLHGHGRAAMEEVIQRTADRIAAVTRGGDLVARLGDDRFGVMIGPVRGQEMEIALSVAERMQGAIAEPISLHGASVHATASAGLCLARRAPRHRGDDLLEAAETALEEARHAGPGSLRAYSPEMQAKKRLRCALEDDLPAALEEGEIRPWFQPQLCAETGRITGFEALARWIHPQRGVIPPLDFLPAVESAGLLERLGETVLFNALSALRAWDKAGWEVPRVGVNFSGPELRDPRLVERVKWELDRFDLAPGRLCVEVLETVVTETGDDTITRNIEALSRLGCAIDLDDFGTGHASIAHIRRFAVGRIKIDRSFVARVDEDEGQQKLVSAVLSMAERLDLDTIAEGVETVGEQAMLARLGCGHVQGYAIARPMPAEETEAWMARHTARLDIPPAFRQGTA